MAQWKFVQGKVTKEEYVEFVRQCAEKDIDRREAVRKAIKKWLKSR